MMFFGLVFLLFVAGMFRVSKGNRARFNPFFLPCAAMPSLAFWAIVVRLRTLDLDAVADAAGRVPVGVISVYLLICVVAWGALWLCSILPATLDNTMPRELAESGMGQNAVWVLDFAFTFPLAAVGALWIWRRRPWVMWSQAR